MISVTELRNGATFVDHQGYWEVVSYRHTKIARSNATIRVKVKNLKTGATIEKTFSSGQKVEDISLVRKKGQYLYSDSAKIVFMDPKSFEQFSFPRSLVGDKEKYLKESENYDLLVSDDQVFGLEMPKLLVLKVIETATGVRGDTVSAATKEATLENKVKVKVPLFIKLGDKLRIDTRTGVYVERVK